MILISNDFNLFFHFNRAFLMFYPLSPVQFFQRIHFFSCAARHALRFPQIFETIDLARKKIPQWQLIGSFFNTLMILILFSIQNAFFFTEFSTS